jgi:hypothetical protein
LTCGRGGRRGSVCEPTVKPIIDKRCMQCHDGCNPIIPNLSGFDNLTTLVRDSHIHFFGLSFIFFIAGLKFSHAYLYPRGE